MIDKDLILSRITLVNNVRLEGVYILLSRKDEVVYVGQSFNMMQRIELHRKNKRMKFSGYSIFTVSELNGKSKEEIEIELIIKFKPLYNFEHNPDYVNGKKELFNIVFKKFDSFQEISNISGVSHYQIKKIVSSSNPKQFMNYELIRDILFKDLSYF